MKPITRFSHLFFVIGMQILSVGPAASAEVIIRDHRRETERVPARRGGTGHVEVVRPQANRESVDRCLSLVRDAMMRERINHLSPKSQEEINTNCNAGNIEGAMSIVRTLGSYEKCSEGLENHIRRNGLIVTDEVRNRALVYCRNGDLRKATEAVNGLQNRNTHNAGDILFFTADNATVQKEQSVTLSWQTANAAQVVLARTDSADPRKFVDRRRVATSGSQVLWPDGSTTYVLLVGGSASWKAKRIDIRVNDF